MRATIKVVVNGIGIYIASVAARPAIEFQGSGLRLLSTVVLVALLFGLFNTYGPPAMSALGVRRPVSVPTIFAGNVLLLWLVARGTEGLADRLYFESFWPVLAGGVIATTVALVLQTLLPDRHGSHREALV